MRLSTQVKPISYFKANAAEVLADLADRREPYVITQNGEAKAVLIDIATYEKSLETLALLKILALGKKDIDEGRTEPLEDVISRLRTKNAQARRQQAE